MTSHDPEAQRLFDEALAAHTARDTARSIDLARRAIAIDPDCAPALEHLATLLITRRRQYGEGLALIERAVETRGGDGLWYALGWCSEFAAHEIRRRGGDDTALDPKALYERAAEAFRRCLALNPGGKLVGDAEDLLDHVENELASM
jgi:tetratricopeptide (TPR) repeat protein